MQIYGLYGISGTGKSYKVQVLARRLEVQAIIDDGILIIDDKHVAGVSAKSEKYLHSATKRAIFYWDKPRMEVRNYLEEEKITKLIVIGTSQKMISKILDRLELSVVPEWIHISLLQSSEEITIAARKRAEGFHAVPVNPISISEIYNGWYEKEKVGCENGVIEISIIKPFKKPELIGKQSRPKIIKNAIQCFSCKDIIQSKSVYDYKTCSCGKVAIDGGNEYLKRSFPPGDYMEWYVELSEWDIKK